MSILPFSSSDDGQCSIDHRDESRNVKNYDRMHVDSRKACPDCITVLQAILRPRNEKHTDYKAHIHYALTFRIERRISKHDHRLSFFSGEHRGEPAKFSKHSLKTDLTDDNCGQRR